MSFMGGITVSCNGYNSFLDIRLIRPYMPIRKKHYRSNAFKL